MKADLAAKLECVKFGRTSGKAGVAGVTGVALVAATHSKLLKLQQLHQLHQKSSNVANDVILDVADPVAASLEPDLVELEERKGMAADSVPEPYLDAWARLQCQKPMRVSDADWRQAIDDAGRFLDQWGSLAVELQWTPADLFDVPRDGGPGGLVWWLAGEAVRALGPEHAVTTCDRVWRRADR